MALVLATRRRLRAADLAAQFSISERTVYRDVRALQSSGFPIEGNPGDGYRVPASAFLRPLALDAGEAGALAIAAQLLIASADAALRAQLLSATAKLESVVSPEVRQRIRSQRAQVYFAASSIGSQGPLGELLSAIDAQAVLRIDYDPVSDRPRTRRDIEPLGIVRVETAWLLVAYCRLRQGLRAFRVDRIREASRTGERYPTRPELSFADFVERERRAFPRS